MPPGKGANSAVSVRGNQLLGNSPEGPPGLAELTDSWGALWESSVLDRTLMPCLTDSSSPLGFSSYEVHLNSWVDAGQKGSFPLPLPRSPWGAVH